MKRKIVMRERRRESKVGRGNQSYALLLGSPVKSFSLSFPVGVSIKICNLHKKRREKVDALVSLKNCRRKNKET